MQLFYVYLRDTRARDTFCSMSKDVYIGSYYLRILKVMATKQARRLVGDHSFHDPENFPEN